MPKSVFSKRYEWFRKQLIACRNVRKLTQAQVAKRLGKPQSFVSKYERGERRRDLVEFLEGAAAIGLEPKQVLEQLEARPPIPKKFILQGQFSRHGMFPQKSYLKLSMPTQVCAV